MPPEIRLLTSPLWRDYQLLDSGDSLKLERFGPYLFIRPEVQALWHPSLPATDWEAAHAVFTPTGEESGGHWAFRKKIAEPWEMGYSGLKFHAMTTSGRHLGVFPECAALWDWMGNLISNRAGHMVNPPNVLNLFGYTGLASLTAAAAGAKVTHVDASKKSVTWARQNAALSGLAEKPIRWIVDDALKFVQREARRGVKFDGILLDPPKFGRGPKGEVWEVYKSLPLLLQACRAVLSGQPLFVALTVYAVKASAVHLYYALEEMMKGFGGKLECGELVTQEKGAGRLLSQAVCAKWESN
jgi:23S rRNA (cytosine1962-C5)-methyltransferase